MQTIRTSRRETLDKLDIETLSEMEDGRGWHFVRARLDKTLAAYMTELLHATSWEGTLRLQGKIEATQLLRSLPKILIEEARNETRNQLRNV